MNHKLKRKWLNSLRGGYYTQCERFLEKDGAMCVMGVLGKIANIDVSQNDLGGLVSNLLREGHFTTEDSAKVGRIVGMNDGGSKKFPEIADWIEDNISGKV